MLVYFATLPKQLTTRKCFQRRPKYWFEFFSKTANFLLFMMKEENFLNTISAKKSVKCNVCLQPRKTLFANMYHKNHHHTPPDIRVNQMENPKNAEDMKQSSGTLHRILEFDFQCTKTRTFPLRHTLPFGHIPSDSQTL
mgnify:CR=1 FL=1